jgi:hypothetical protein
VLGSAEKVILSNIFHLLPRHQFSFTDLPKRGGGARKVRFSLVCIEIQAYKHFVCVCVCVCVCVDPTSFCFLLLCWVGIYCGIYKDSYNVSNISYLNSPPPVEWGILEARLQNCSEFRIQNNDFF